MNASRAACHLDAPRIFKTMGGRTRRLCFVKSEPSRSPSPARGRNAAHADAQELRVVAHRGGRPGDCFRRQDRGRPNVPRRSQQAVAEELQRAVASITFVLADTARSPFDSGTLVSEYADMVPQIRRVAATARKHCSISQRKTERRPRSLNARVKNLTPLAIRGRIRRLTKAEKLLVNVSDSIPTHTRDAWKVMGTSTAKVDGAALHHRPTAYAPIFSVPACCMRGLGRRNSGATLAPSMRRAESIRRHLGATATLLGVTAGDRTSRHRAVGALRAEWKITPQIFGSANSSPI